MVTCKRKQYVHIGFWVPLSELGHVPGNSTTAASNKPGPKFWPVSALMRED